MCECRKMGNPPHLGCGEWEFEPPRSHHFFGGYMPKVRSKAKVITHKNYEQAVEMLEEFLSENMVYTVKCLPEKQGTYGFLVYY